MRSTTHCWWSRSPSRAIRATTAWRSGGEKGRKALERLRHVLGRKAAQWRPASSEESFEIVRRRLFEPMEPSLARHRDAVVKAYHDLYMDNVGEFPSETRERDYEADGRRVPDPSRVVRPALPGLVDVWSGSSGPEGCCG